MNDPKTFLKPVENDLKRVENILSGNLSSAISTLDKASKHILLAGGKRLRPALVALTARACGGEINDEKLAVTAACTELIHMATLMHDDVIDEADSRRGKPTARAVWGNQISVLAGDYMLSRAFSLLAPDADSRVLLALAGATVSMTEGEVSQIEARGSTQVFDASYLEIIHDKTAAFMSACCRAGAIIGGGTDETIESLSRYGLRLGLAFQITDDLLDIAGDPAVTGKPIGRDIREGKITMPVILTWKRASSEDKKKLENAIGREESTDEEIEEIRALAQATGSLDATREAAASYIDQAVEDLAPLPDSAPRTSLTQLARFILDRKS